MKESLAHAEKVLPAKRKRKQTTTSTEFVSGDRLKELDEVLIQPDMTYAYALPLHMGGRRRSSRTIQKELIEEQGSIVDMMRKFPLPSLLGKRFPKSKPAPITTPATPRSEPSNATCTPQSQVVSTESPVRVLRTTVIDLTAAAAATPERHKTTPTKRRRQIQFAYELLGTPPEFVTVQGQDVEVNQWDGKDGVINTIAAYLLLSTHWRTRLTIRKVIQFVQDQLGNGKDLRDIDAGPKAGAHRSGRKRKMTPEMDVLAARCLQRGYGLEMTTTIIAQKVAPMEIHQECVRRSAKRAYSGKCHNRATKKTGNKDKSSKWAVARKGFGLQLSEQFRDDTPGESMVGKRVCRQFEGEWWVGRITSYDAVEDLYMVEYPDDDKEEVEYNELFVEEWKKIHRDSVLWVDEKHKKIRIGRANRHEWLFHVDPADPTKLMRKEDGGVLEEERPCTKGKFMGECRGAFGVMRKVVDGELVGDRMVPFDYTNQKVVGPVAYQKAFDAEVHRVNTLKTTGSPSSQYWPERGEGLVGGAYEARYGVRWREEVKAKLGRGSGAMCNVCDIMDHVIAEGNRLFRGTPFEHCWVIYHDALSQWWSKGAQDYIETTYPGFATRQCRGLGHTNEGTSYEGKLPGDTPEYMPLDSNLFSDLEVSVRWNVAATFELPRDHPDKFDLTTPTSAWSAVKRSWKYAPVSARIVEDIERVFDAIEDVIEADGCAVDFKKLRHGRREEEHRRSARRARARKSHKHFDRVEGLHPVSKQCIIDLCDL